MTNFRIKVYYKVWKKKTKFLNFDDECYQKKMRRKEIGVLIDSPILNFLFKLHKTFMMMCEHDQLTKKITEIVKNDNFVTTIYYWSFKRDQKKKRFIHNKSKILWTNGVIMSK